MPSEPVDELLEAIRRTALKAGQGAASHPADALAQLLLRAAADERDGVHCPAGVRARLSSIPAAAERTWTQRLAGLVFDSWTAAAAAPARGAATSRLLRFEDDLGVLDVQIEADGQAASSLLVGVEDALAGGRVSACSTNGAELTTAPIDEHGAARLEMPASVARLTLKLVDAEGLWFETPVIDLYLEE